MLKIILSLRTKQSVVKQSFLFNGLLLSCFALHRKDKVYINFCKKNKLYITRNRKMQKIILSLRTKQRVVKRSFLFNGLLLSCFALHRKDKMYIKCFVRKINFTLRETRKILKIILSLRTKQSVVKQSFLFNGLLLSCFALHRKDKLYIKCFVRKINFTLGKTVKY
jgi:hypothetical protein